MRTLLIPALISMCAALPVAAQQPDAIGHVQSAQGSVVVQRDATTVAVTAGGALYRGDIVRTGRPGSAGIVLLDDTAVSMGPDSALLLSEHVFEPKEAKFKLVMKMIKGTFVYVSGMLSKLAPESIQLSVPDAILSVRGTRLLVEVPEYPTDCIESCAPAPQ